MTIQKTIEQKYRKLDDIEHCLERPGMWIGTTKTRQEDVLLFSPTGKLEKKTVLCNPGLLKIFDEIVSNSADEHRRNPKLDTLDVTVDIVSGRITTRDNGGIVVAKHPAYDMWVPELIFSNLKAGSNFDDSEERLLAGTNGVGATLTNIFSLEFSVKTCDGKNSFLQLFRNNMRNRDDPVIKKCKGGFTEISFIPDYSRFGMTEIDETHIEMMRRRCVDIAACNPKMTVTFSGTSYKFPSFFDYCKLYEDDLAYEESSRWKVGIGASDGAFRQVSFVNGIETKDGGTHVDYIASQLVDWLREKIKKKHKLDLRPSEIKSHLSIYVNADIVNSAFSSQTKEKLITDPREFGSKYEISEKVLKKVFESEAVKQILDWAQQKALADERKQLRDLNKNLGKEKVVKLIDAKSKTNRELCSLLLFEGESAAAAFRQYRDPMTQGAYTLRGKIINVTETPNSKLIQNQEIKDLLASIGLKLGEPPKDLRYGKVLIYTDADPDGDSIAGLIVNFFAKFWPELFESEVICRVMTPLVVVKKKSETLLFYTSEEFENWQSEKSDLKTYDIAYKKGLASLVDSEYKEIIQTPKLFTFTKGEDFRLSLDNWFGPDSAPRKIMILGDESKVTE